MYVLHVGLIGEGTIFRLGEQKLLLAKNNQDNQIHAT